MPTLPPTPDAVNPQPGFYAVIPAPVRYCKQLPANAKLLYGELTALCSAAGYCWAANSYFVALYDVDDRTVRRWLAALVKCGFIKIFVTGPKRRIYLAEAAPKPAKSRAKMSGLGGQKCPGKPGKNVRHSITVIKTKNSTSEDARGGVRFVGPGPVPARDLRQREEVTASPSTVESKSEYPRTVMRAVALCGDISARRRFSELWTVVERAVCVDLWQDGLDAVKSARGPATGILEAPTAVFERVILSGLARRGLAGLVGSECPPASALAFAGGGPQPPQQR